ncbi:TPA: GNAT family N-acetyltransferase, partial [Bacillus thuringiensis]|nr:GNAT family N-acetyltransferase [Bacillus thuringiensis]
GLKRIVAITTIDNINSGKLLEKVGFQFEEIISDSGENLKLFGYNI